MRRTSPSPTRTSSRSTTARTLSQDADHMGSEQCTQCHTRTARSRRPGIIIDHAIHEENDVHCTLCHNRVAHPEDFELTLAGNEKHDDFMEMTACFRCHGLDAMAEAPGACEQVSPCGLRAQAGEPLRRRLLPGVRRLKRPRRACARGGLADHRDRSTEEQKADEDEGERVLPDRRVDQLLLDVSLRGVVLHRLPWCRDAPSCGLRGGSWGRREGDTGGVRQCHGAAGAAPAPNSATHATTTQGPVAAVDTPALRGRARRKAPRHASSATIRHTVPNATCGDSAARRGAAREPLGLHRSAPGDTDGHATTATADRPKRHPTGTRPTAATPSRARSDRDPVRGHPDAGRRSSTSSTRGCSGPRRLGPPWSDSSRCSRQYTQRTPRPSRMGRLRQGAHAHRAVRQGASGPR